MGGLLEEKDSAYPASDYEDDDEEENEEARTRRLLGFMFGNVDDAGVLDEEYLDQDAKEHMDALADQLGPSLEDLELSTKRKGFGSRPEPDEEHEDYAKKAEGAIDYEDIQEEYEGPEVQVLGQDEHFYAQAALAVPLQKPGSSFVAEEDNYDEDDDAAEDTREVDHVEAESVVVPSTEAQVVVVPEKEDVAPVPGSVSPKDLGREESVKHDMAGEEVGKEESQIPEISGVREQSPQEDPSSTKSHQQDATKIELPVLCEEDGKEVLRFSELFGVREPYWVLGCRKGRPRRHLFKEQSCTAEHDETDVEDDEETIFQSSSVGQEIRHLISNPEMSKDESHQDILEHGDSSDDNESDSDSDYERMDLMRGVRVDFCPAEPMKVSSEDCEEILRWRENLPEANFDPVHQQDWETDILWDRRNLQARSPHGEVLADFRAERDSDSEQEGTSFSGANIIGHGQHTKPRDVVSWSETINLKPWVNPEPLSRFPVDSDERLDGFGTRRHPQMLRLESLDLGTIPNSQDRNVDLHPGELGARLSKLNLVCSEKNREFASGSWLDSVLWNSSSPTREVQYKPSQVTYDLQDRNMVFEIASDIWDQDLRAHAAAVILPPSGMKNSGDNGSEALVSSASSLNRFNISNDKYYTNKKVQHQQKSHAKKRAVHGVKVMHSLPAIKLQTMKPKLTNKDLANFHRPKAVWYPHHNEVAAKEQGKLAVTGPMKVILKTLGGKGSKLHVDASETVEVLKVKAAKKLGDLKASEVTKVLYTGKELEEGRTFAEQQVPPNSVLHLVRTEVYPWPKAQRLPGENKPIRPPGAFKKKSELSVKDGHVALMEYCEERPLLLSNVGMGARLSTYYRKLTPTDSTAVNLRNERGSWMGFPLPLEPTEDSPFLGDIRPGDKVSSLETNMYRSPAFGHKVAHTDFLLVRSAKGKLSLRRIDSLHVVGQQEPHLEVLTPTSKGVQNYIGQRLLVHVYREFRNNEKPKSIPRVQAEELISQFPSLTEGFIRKRLKHCADMQKGTGGEMWWVMRRNFRIPSEEELRRMVSPEMVCTCESMQAGLHHLKRMGVQKLTQASGLSAAMNMLPDEAITLAAASHIERELQITPWNLSSNFVSATLQGRGSLERLEITGAGDPSGRGLGFSYLRVATKPPNVGAIVEKKAAVARGGGAVTGTDADLRRLSMDAAREVLLKFKVSEAQIDKLTRWHRIALVRKLSSEQAASLGKVGVAALNKFARGQRMSFLQLQQQTREKCQEIWDRQAQSLAIAEGEDSESDGEANGDLDSFAGDLENLLEAEEGEDGEERKGRREGMRGLGGRRRALQAQKEEEMEDEEAEAAELRRMLLEDDEADEEHTKKNGGSAGKESKTPVNTKQTGASGSGTTAAAKKKKRVLKRIIRTKRADGTYTSKEVIITDPKEVAAYLAKKAQSKVSGMKPVGDKPVVPKKGATKPKKEKKVQVPKIVAKVKATVKKVSKESAGKEKPGRDGQQFVCGACGQLGHMRTNKKCPLYMEDADGNAQRQEITSVGAVPERPGIKITIKKKKVEELHIAKLKKPSGTSKVTVKKTVKTSRRPLGKIPALKIKIPSSGNLCDTKVDRNGSKLEGSRIAGLPQDGVDAGPSLVEVDVKEAETGFSHQPLKATKLRVPKKSKKKKAKDKKPSKQQTQSKGQSSGARGADEDTGTGIQSAKRNQPAKRKENFDQHLADVKVQRLEMEREGAERTTELKHLERGNLEREQLRRETEVQNWERERQALMEREREEQEEREREEQEERDREEQIEREREHQILGRERMKKAREQMERDREQFLEKERLRKIREQKKKDRQLERQRDKELMEKQLQMEKEVKEREEQERIEAQRLKELRDKKKQRIREEKERVERQKEAEMRVLRELEMERERVKQERLERERQERERERVREKMERERLELERMEKERQERERLERQERERLEDEKLAREKERKQKSRQKVLNEKLRKKKEEEERMLELQKEKVREQRHQGEKPKGRARVTISAEKELRTPREVPREPTVEKDRVRVGKKRTRSVAGAGSQRTSDPPKRQRTRGGSEVVLANMFEAIVNILVKSKVAYLFVKPVSKKEAPDYLDYVKTPMDLGTIRDKARKMRYKSRLDFRTDVEQIVLNAHEYNDNRNPGIPPLAEALLELCDGELRSRRAEFEDAEDAVERFDDDEPYTPNGRPSPPLDRRRRQRAI